MDTDRLQPALFGGLFIGVLSALPFVNLGNCCCCLWAIAGGVLATYLRQQNSRYQVTSAEGALVGLMAGAIGGVIYVVLSLALQPLIGPMSQQWMEAMMSSQGDLPPEVRDMMENMGSVTAIMGITLFFNAIFYTIFGLLGGLLGVALFKKDAPPPPPPGTIEVLPPE
jgi:hypothetical protein